MIFLGCDGGSTKTEWLLVDHTGQVLGSSDFSRRNFAFWGEDGFRDLMVLLCSDPAGRQRHHFSADYVRHAEPDCLRRGSRYRGVLPPSHAIHPA